MLRDEVQQLRRLGPPLQLRHRGALHEEGVEVLLVPVEPLVDCAHEGAEPRVVHLREVRTTPVAEVVPRAELGPAGGACAGSARL